MGCFCRLLEFPPVPPLDVALSAALTVPPVVPGLSAWLSARWLPPAMPWVPDLGWLDATLPTVAIPRATVAAAIGLLNARAALIATLQLDPLIPAQLPALARIVATLNLRLPSLAPLAADWRPWSALAVLNGQLDTIQAALTAGVFTPAHAHLNLALAGSPANPTLPGWRALLARLLALLPVLTMAEMLKLDLSLPGAAAQLTATIRGLRLIRLPALAMPHLVLQLVARFDAAMRLQASLGPLPFPALRLRVQAKLAAVLALLPPGLSIAATAGAGGLVGLPNLLPNPSSVINAPTMAAALRLGAGPIAGLRWSAVADVPLPLVAVGAPVAALIAATVATGLAPVRLSPCGAGCDAARALAAAL